MASARASRKPRPGTMLGGADARTRRNLMAEARRRRAPAIRTARRPAARFRAAAPAPGQRRKEAKALKGRPCATFIP
jgi:hypothetical protein